MTQTHSRPDDCAEAPHVIGARAVDNSSWDGPAAMARCASKPSPATCYESICAGRKAGDAALQSSWALPHHANPGDPPNAAGCRNALARLPQTQGLTNEAAARRHLEAHMSAVGSGTKSADHEHEPVRADLYRGISEQRMPCGLRDEGPASLGVMTVRFVVYDQWTEIDSFFEGRFLERVAPGAARDAAAHPELLKVLFQHGRDPQIGSKLLGPIREIVDEPASARAEVPLDDTSYNRDLLPGLRRGGYGASFRFSIPEGGEQWNHRPGRSERNPEGLPERTILTFGHLVREFGPVTFPAYSGATAGMRDAMRSLTDLFTDHDHTGRPVAWSAGGGDLASAEPGNGEAHDHPSAAALARDRALRLATLRRYER